MPSDSDSRRDDMEPSPDERIDAFDRRLTALEAELDSVRGLLGGIEAVDEAVERRASIALAKAEALERAVGADDDGLVRERLPEADPEDNPTIRAVAASDAPDEPRSTDRRPTGRRVDPRSADRGGEPDAPEDSLASRLRDAFR